MLVPAAAQAQSTGDTQRKLEKVNRELKEVADERRKIEGRRGDASRQLREVDEKVGESTRGLSENEAELARQQAARSEAHTLELQSLIRTPYAVICLQIQRLTPLTNTH